MTSQLPLPKDRKKENARMSPKQTNRGQKRKKEETPVTMSDLCVLLKYGNEQYAEIRTLYIDHSFAALARTRSINGAHGNAAVWSQLCASCPSQGLAHGFDIQVAGGCEAVLAAARASNRLPRRAHLNALDAPGVARGWAGTKALTGHW